MQCSQVHDVLGALLGLDPLDIETKSALSDSPVKKSPVSSSVSESSSDWSESVGGSLSGTALAETQVLSLTQFFFAFFFLLLSRISVFTSRAAAESNSGNRC